MGEARRRKMHGDPMPKTRAVTVIGVSYSRDGMNARAGLMPATVRATALSDEIVDACRAAWTRFSEERGRRAWGCVVVDGPLNVSPPNSPEETLALVDRHRDRVLGQRGHIEPADVMITDR